MSFFKRKLQGGTTHESVKEFATKSAIQKGIHDSEDDTTRKAELGTVFEFGHDEGAELLQDTGCFEEQQVYVVNEKGEALLDEKGNRQIATIDKIQHHNAAMRVYNSPRNQWRVLEQEDIEIAALSMRSGRLKRLASMPRDSYDTGEANFWQAIENNAVLNLCDSRKGNKFRIMNTRRNVIEYGEIPKQKKTGGIM